MNRIRQLRRQKNMTQQEVGQALGVGNTAVSRVCHFARIAKAEI